MRIVRSTRPAPCGSRSRTTWPLTGRTGTASGTSSIRATGAPAASTTLPAATLPPPARATPDTLTPSCRSRSARAVDHLDARQPGGRRQRRDEPPRVDGVVAGDVQREPDGRRERRLGAPRGARQQARDIEAQALAEGEQPVELLRLVAVARHDERARLPVARVLAGALGQLRAEGGEAGGGAGGQAEQRVLAELGLRGRREHAGGDVPGAGRAVVEQGDGGAALSGAPGRGEADRPTADHHHLMLHGHCALLPYAGTTRIRFDGRRPRAALSARSAGSRMASS